MKTLNIVKKEIKPFIHSIIPFILLFGLSNINLFLGIFTSILYWAFVGYIYFGIKKEEPISYIIFSILLVMLISGL